MRNNLMSMSMIALITFLPYVGLMNVGATPIPTLDVPALTREANLIAIGRISSIEEQGHTNIEMVGGQSISARQMIATLRVNRMIKGRSDKPTLFFRFFIPDSSLAYASIIPTQIGMFFLRETQQQEYVILNPYYPFIVAAPEALTARGSDLDQVVAELAHVITSSRVSQNERSAAIAALDTVKTVAATVALRDAAMNNDATLRILAAGALLRRNDISVMSMVENMLLRPAESEKPMLGSVAFNLEGVKDPKAIPSLSRLLDAGDIQTRRAAAAALRNTGSPSAIEPLSKGLEDNDIEVRYSAVIGLAEITKQYGHGPAVDLYMQDEQRYLTYWQGWAKNRR
jgi:hypothetical protein